MRRTILQFVAVSLAIVLAVAGCCAACPAETAPTSPASSSHDCCPSKEAPAKKSHSGDSQSGSCPQCMENKYKAPDGDLSKVVTAAPSPVYALVGHDMPAAAAIVSTAPLPSSHTALYLRLSTLLI